MWWLLMLTDLSVHPEPFLPFTGGSSRFAVWPCHRHVESWMHTGWNAYWWTVVCWLQWGILIWSSIFSISIAICISCSHCSMVTLMDSELVNPGSNLIKTHIQTPRWWRLEWRLRAKVTPISLGRSSNLHGEMGKNPSCRIWVLTVNAFGSVWVLLFFCLSVAAWFSSCQNQGYGSNRFISRLT